MKKYLKLESEGNEKIPFVKSTMSTIQDFYDFGRVGEYFEYDDGVYYKIYDRERKQVKIIVK